MLGLQLPPFLDFLGVVLQMGAHDALHEAREVGSSISQSADNEVGALLCRPTQIDCPTFDQLDGDEESLLVSLQRPSSHFGADAFRCECTLGMHGLLGWLCHLWTRFSQIDVEKRTDRFITPVRDKGLLRKVPIAYSF